MSLDNNNNPIPQKLNIDNEIDQIYKISKMNQINLQTKIQLLLSSMDFKYLYLEDRRFIIYTGYEILIFDKKLNFKKLFPSNNNDDRNHDISFVKYINKGYILFPNYKDVYIANIK